MAGGVSCTSALAIGLGRPRCRRMNRTQSYPFDATKAVPTTSIPVESSIPGHVGAMVELSRSRVGFIEERHGPDARIRVYKSGKPRRRLVTCPMAALKIILLPSHRMEALLLLPDSVVRRKLDREEDMYRRTEPTYHLTNAERRAWGLPIR